VGRADRKSVERNECVVGSFRFVSAEEKTVRFCMRARRRSAGEWIGATGDVIGDFRAPSIAARKAER
jgi:hypothetical protein